MIEPNHGSPEELPELQADEENEHERTFISLHDVTKTVTVNESEDSPHRTLSSTETSSDFTLETKAAGIKPADPLDELSVPGYETEYHKSRTTAETGHSQKSWVDGAGIGHSTTESSKATQTVTDLPRSQPRNEDRSSKVGNIPTLPTLSLSQSNQTEPAPSAITPKAEQPKGDAWDIRLWALVIATLLGASWGDGKLYGNLKKVGPNEAN